MASRPGEAGADEADSRRRLVPALPGAARGGDAGCTPACPPRAVSEREACGDDANGGCNVDPASFELLEPGVLVCGSTWMEAGAARDTDWYLLPVDDADGDGAAMICATVTSEVPTCIAIVDAGDCGAPVVLGAPAEATCAPGTAWACVKAPGEYVVWIAHGPCEAPNLDNPCGGANDYLLCTSVTDACGSSCPACPVGSCAADLDGSGVVGIADLLALLAAWGSAGHRADLDGDGLVGIGDAALLLAAWGPCP